MKTPRELLLERHRAVDPRLDAVRAAVLSSVTSHPAPEPPSREPRPSIVQWVLSLRWHLAGISAAWIVVALANQDGPAMNETFEPAPPPLVARRVEALRENRRQLAELLDGGIGFADPAQPVIRPSRRSEQTQSTWMA